MTEAAHRPMYGESGYERVAGDAYWTPEWCTDALLTQVKLRGRVWEPASGKGHICRVLSKWGYEVKATDIADHGHFDELRNFLDYRDPPRDVESIVTNPPYVLADQFVRHACAKMDSRKGVVAMLLRNEWDSAASRMDLMALLRLKLVLTKRPRWSEDDKASPRHNFAWFIWDFSYTGKPEIAWTNGTAQERSVGRG